MKKEKFSLSCKNATKENKYNIETGNKAKLYYGILYQYQKNHFEAELIYEADGLYILSNFAYYELKKPTETNGLLKYYINPDLFENEIYIGKTQIKFERTIKEEIKIYAKNLDGPLELCGNLKDLNGILNLGKTSPLIEQFSDALISTDHCFLGFDSKFKLFYLIESGKNKNGSSNGTQIKIKKNNPFRLDGSCVIRIISEKADYKMSFIKNEIGEKF